MGLLDRILGREPARPQYSTPPAGHQPAGAPHGSTRSPQPQASEDERAVARYRYLLRTAPPEQVEQVHAEAFAKLTPEQRTQVLHSLSDLPEGERPTSDDPQSLARAATRAEMSNPGTLQQRFAGAGGRQGPGMGTMIGGSLLGTVAGVMIGSALAQSLFGGYEGSPEAGEVGEASDAGADAGDAGAEGDVGGGDAGGGDVGGGDFGGGDFGGGDVGGGGDFGGDFGF